MILSGKEIAYQLSVGHIAITPFSKAQLNPASYDLRLGKRVIKFGPASRFDPKNGLIGSYFTDYMSDEGYDLEPGLGYLMHTEEVVKTDHFVPVIEGKSSLARMFLQIHMTAGYVDPGFEGQYTLEVIARYPTRVYPGMRIGQVRFHQVSGEIDLYKGNYQGPNAMGPVPSKAHNQIGT